MKMNDKQIINELQTIENKIYALQQRYKMLQETYQVNLCKCPTCNGKGYLCNISANRTSSMIDVYCNVSTTGTSIMVSCGKCHNGLILKSKHEESSNA